MASHQVHHFVPAAYFRPWCTSNGQLTHFSWRAGRLIPGRANPKHIARAHQLYSLRGAPIDRAQEVETRFFTPIIDAPGAAIHQTLLSNSTTALTPSERHQWARYLMALRVRTPEVIESARRHGSSGVREALRTSQNEYEAIRPNDAPPTLEECVDPWYLDNFGVARVIPAVIDQQETRATIVQMDWWCEDFSDCEVSLLTCDRPLCWHKGTKDPDFLIGLPLSPKVAFFATRSPRIRKLLHDLPLRELARKFNETTVTSAVEYVYASNEGARRFIERRLRRPKQ